VHETEPPIPSTASGVPGANLGAFRRTAPQTVMDARGQFHGDDCQSRA
jgi:hypothetical protein